MMHRLLNDLLGMRAFGKLIQVNHQRHRVVPVILVYPPYNKLLGVLIEVLLVEGDGSMELKSWLKSRKFNSIRWWGNVMRLRRLATATNEKGPMNVCATSTGRVFNMAFSFFTRRSYCTFTSTALGLAFSPFGRCTFNTPSLNSAFTFEASAPSGSVKLRKKFPYDRSMR